MSADFWIGLFGGILLGIVSMLLYNYITCLSLQRQYLKWAKENQQEPNNNNADWWKEGKPPPEFDS